MIDERRWSDRVRRADSEHGRHTVGHTATRRSSHRQVYGEAQVRTETTSGPGSAADRPTRDRGRVGCDAVGARLSVVGAAGSLGVGRPPTESPRAERRTVPRDGGSARVVAVVPGRTTTSGRFGRGLVRRPRRVEPARRNPDRRARVAARQVRRQPRRESSSRGSTHDVVPSSTPGCWCTASASPV